MHGKPKQVSLSTSKYESMTENRSFTEAAGISPKVLKYQLRHSVSGILATNIMAIAHIFYPENVQIINDNSGKPLAVQGGQGRW